MIVTINSSYLLQTEENLIIIVLEVANSYFHLSNKAKRVVTMTLNKLAIGKKSKIVAINGQGALRRRLLDMGLTPHTEVMVRKVAPMGDPIELHLRGYELTLRMDDAREIVIEEV